MVVENAGQLTGQERSESCGTCRQLHTSSLIKARSAYYSEAGRFHNLSYEIGLNISILSIVQKVVFVVKQRRCLFVRAW